MRMRFLSCSLAIACLALCIAPPVSGSSLTLPDAALISPEFTKAWGPGSFTRTDIAGPGVLYEFTGLGSSGTAVSDNYPLLELYGQVGGSDFTNFTDYTVSLTNQSPSGYVHVNIFVNTGFTSGSDGGHSHSAACDTYWEDGWTYLGAGSSVNVTFSFSSATAWNISDNPPPHSIGSPDGGTYEMNMYDRGQFTRIGFQVADFSGGSNPNASLIVKAYEEPVPVRTRTWGMIKALYR